MSEVRTMTEEERTKRRIAKSIRDFANKMIQDKTYRHPTIFQHPFPMMEDDTDDQKTEEETP